MKPINQSKDLIKGAFILALAALITKILSAVYRIPFQNIVGDVGFYIYQQIYPFYGAAIVLGTTGFPVVISKLLAEYKEKGDLESSRRFLLASFIFLQLFGFLCFLVLFTGSGPIAGLMQDSKLSILLKVVSFVFLLFPLVSLLRGYYQGVGDMIPTAISQVGEQLIRVLTIILLSFFLMHKGYSLYFVGGGAMFGSITGSLISAFLLITFWLVRKEWKWLGLQKTSLREMLKGSGWIYKLLIYQGLTICISGMLMIFVQMADAMNLYSLLVSSGIGQEAAKTIKGIFDRGQPLIQLGTVSATSMSLSLVPLIASERLKKNKDFLYGKIKLSLQLSIVVGAGATLGLWAIIGPVNTMLFKNDAGSSVLGVLSFVILLCSIISTITAIMQGMGNLMFPALTVIMTFPLKYGLNQLLVPRYGTMGAAVATILALTLLCIVLSVKLKRIVDRPLFTGNYFKAIIVAGLFMVLFLKGYLFGTEELLHRLFRSGRIADAFQALSAAVLGGMVFVWIVIRWKVFSEEDLLLLPFGSKLSLFLKSADRGAKSGGKN